LAGLFGPAAPTDPLADNAPPDMTYSPEALIQGPYAGSAYTGQGDFPSFANVTDPNTQGWWEMTVIHPSGAELTKGLLNFDGDGSLNANQTSTGINIDLNNIDWGNGSSPQTIDIDVERFSQFSGNFDVIFSDHL